MRACRVESNNSHLVSVYGVRLNHPGDGARNVNLGWLLMHGNPRESNSDRKNA